jgi:murein L,D-transpeptidase YcbB/YkuD
MQPRTWTVVIAVCATWSASAGSIEGGSPDAAVRAEIVSLLAVPGGSALGERLVERAVLARFYEGRGNQPGWLQGNRLNGDLARDLLGALRRSEEHGLRPDAYHSSALARAVAQESSAPDRLASLDVLLSDAFLHLAHDLAQGAVDPGSLNADFERRREPSIDAAQTLAAALASGQIAEPLEASAPPHPEYHALVRALGRLRAAQTVGQRNAIARADQVRANLERWRWLPRDLGRQHLRVNAATFLLQAFEAGEPRLAMRVVVGEPGWKTPLAHGAISHLVLNPAWRVPRSIATREMLPAARRDPGYFRSRELQVWAPGDSGMREIDSTRVDWRAVDATDFRYQIRQRPGPYNPLGRIKFLFANAYGVYLHGTPGDLAFARALRAMSHGCVRVEDEIALAEFALAPDPSWTHERLLETLRSSWEYRLPLPEPLPIHLVYFTVAARPDGSAEFAKDPYGWDRELIAALKAR